MRRLFFICCLFLSLRSTAQNVEHAGWFVYFTTVKLNKHFGIQADMQVRSADHFDYVKLVLIRPGFTWFMNSKQNVTIGYLNQETNRHLVGTANNFLAENDSWEQFIQIHKAGVIQGSHRFRLEQRFLEQPAGNTLYAQRFRYFTRYVFPLLKPVDETFSKGPFIAAQNEVFFNVQHKEILNDSWFDQNRTLVAAGFRFSRHADAELGYVHQVVNGKTINTVNHVVQLGIYNRF